MAAPSPPVHGKTNTALLLFVVIVLGLPSITKPISLQAAGRDLFAYHSVKEEEASEGVQSSSIYILLINNTRRKGKLLFSSLENLSPKLGLAQGFSNCNSSQTALSGVEVGLGFWHRKGSFRGCCVEHVLVLSNNLMHFEPS